MVITFTTGCVIAVCSALGLFGAGKGVKAAIDNSNANDTNERAETMLARAKAEAQSVRDKLSSSLTFLGKKRIFVREQPLAQFVEIFSKIRNFDTKKLPMAKEPLIQEFNIDEIKAENLKFMDMMKGTASGLAVGGLMAFGAYGTVGAFATASTGTAIASLSGAAATNATLACLGGGTIAAGGGGVAAGTAVLGGLVAGPALAIFGSVVGAQASAKLDQAKSNIAKARKIKEELKSAIVAMNALKDQAHLFIKLTNDLCEIFIPQLESLAAIVNERGTDYRKYTKKAQDIVVKTVTTYQVLRALVDASIMTKEGTLDANSGKIANMAQGKLQIWQ